MPKLLVLIASVRQGRVGGAVGEWVAAHAREHGGFELDVVDLAELRLPLMEEPNHPRLREYTEPHTHAWSERVGTADAAIFVMPEYNHSYTAPLKNAIDYLHGEWRELPVGLVSYGGLSGGGRAIVALQPVMMSLGMHGVVNNVELAWVREHFADGRFEASERQERLLQAQLAELAELIAARA